MASSSFFEVIEKIREGGSIPTLPTIATRVMELAGNPDSKLPEIAKVIETDPALSARVLKVINSALYGMREEIASVSRAILLLGLTEIRSITIGQAVMQMFPGSGNEDEFDRNEFWNHCLATGHLSKIIATRLGFKFQGEDYTAGLLHDIGKILMDQYFHEEFAAAIQRSREGAIPLYKAEAELIGATHFQVGGWLVKHWHLPHTIQDAVTFHHNPAAAKDSPTITAVVYMANLVAQSKELGSSGNAFRARLANNPGWKIIQESLPDCAEKPFEEFLADIDEEIEQLRASAVTF